MLHLPEHHRRVLQEIGRHLLRKLANYPSSSTENVHKKWKPWFILRLGLCQNFVALQRKWSLFCGWCFKSTLGGKRQVPLTRLMILRNLDTCGFKGHHSPWRVFMLEKDCLVQLGWDHPKGFKARCFEWTSQVKDEATFYYILCIVKQHKLEYPQSHNFFQRNG